MDIVVIYCKEDEHYLEGLLYSIKDLDITLALTVQGDGEDTTEVIYNGNQKLTKKTLYYKELDFAELRNRAKKDCKGWVLSLDADERISNPEILKPLTHELDKKGIQAGICHITNVLHNNKIEVSTMKAVRLFKNLDFENPIHEKIITELDGGSAKVSDTTVLINHFGYIGREKLIKKLERNLKLLEKHQHNKYLYDKLTQTYIDKIKLERGNQWLNQM